MVLENDFDSYSASSFTEDKLQTKAYRASRDMVPNAAKGAQRPKGATKQQGAEARGEEGRGAWGELYQSREHFTDMHCF